MHPLLRHIERLGNRIPHPSLMFFWLCIGVIVLSMVSQWIGVSAVNPVDQSHIMAKSLVSAEGLRFILTHMVKNFTGFAPLGIVLVAMLGIGIAEKSGVLAQALQAIAHFAKGKWLTLVVAFAGVMSSLAADSGYVILIPLAALLYKTAGRPAIEGIATAFAGVAGGFSANLLVGPIDAVLAGISTESANLVVANLVVLPTSNWLFGIASTLFISVLIVIVTDRRDWQLLAADEIQTDDDQAFPATQDAKPSFKGIGLFSILFVGIVLLLSLPEGAPLRDPETGSLTRSPLVSSIVVIIALYFAGIGLIYGKVNGVFKEGKDIMQAMEDTMATMAGYLVLMFFAAQFVAYFNWSNLGLIIAVEGAQFLTTLNVAKPILLVLFILISAFINLFIGSASAKWALIAPIFVPMLMLLDVPPELTQQAYRIGDSSTNMITPMMPYFALVLSFLQRHNPNAGMGTLIAAMLPYSIAFLVFWTLLFLAWTAFGIPLGI